MSSGDERERYWFFLQDKSAAGLSARTSLHIQKNNSKPAADIKIYLANVVIKLYASL